MATAVTRSEGIDRSGRPAAALLLLRRLRPVRPLPALLSAFKRGQSYRTDCGGCWSQWRGYGGDKILGGNIESKNLEK